MSNKLKAASTSIFANIGLLISKIVAAILTGSIGMLAECLRFRLIKEVADDS